MDRYFLHADERDTWNAFIAGTPSGHILQSWEWGELKSRAGQSPIRMALREQGSIVAAAQVLLRPLPLGMGAIAYVPKGPVLNYDDTRILETMLACLRALAAQYGVVSLKIEPEVLDGALAAVLQENGLKAAPPVQMRSTIWVDLSPSEDEILAKQKQKTRYNTRLAAKKGVTVSHGGISDLDAWYRMYEATARRDGFSVHGLQYYRDVLDVLGSDGMASLMLAHHEGDLLAGIIVFRFGDKAQYMYGASSNEKRNLMAPYLLQWEAMRWAKANGATMYDLWGIPDRLEESEDLWGVYRHKRGYGGEIVRYAGAFDLVQAPLRHAALERIARPLYKRVARRHAQQAQ